MGTKKGLSYDYEFHQLAAVEDGVGMEWAVLDFLTELLNFWLEQTHEAFENFLRIFKQKYARVKRVLGVLSARESCIFIWAFCSQRSGSLRRSISPNARRRIWSPHLPGRVPGPRKSCSACTGATAEVVCATASWRRHWDSRTAP